MFGEESIYGQSIIHLDDKKRIILPKYTGAEKGDKLVIVRKKGRLYVEREDILDRKIKELERLCSRSVDPEKAKFEIEFYKMCSSILKKVTCDSQRRITLGDELDSDEIKCIGARESLILEPQKK
jgi:DNA-binding transcriptional regulator/RsmH inhibitor MraZ